MNRLVIPSVLVILAVAGCGGGDGDAREKVAERRIAKSTEALAEARAKLVAQVDAFCRTGGSYVTALDRYGDLITSTAPTVADVKEAGADLAAPKSDVSDAVEQFGAARDEVAEAEKELASLLAGQSAAASPSPSPSASEPLVSPATVDRVKQAEADFTATQEGISDQTPLRDASERFNAAVVALEMSWAGLLSEAGCLSEDQRRQARDYTLAVQKSLAEAGYYAKEIDGVYGPTTVAAVQALQKANTLPETGTVDKATDAALQAELRAKGGAAADEAIATTSAVQQTLKLAGFWPVEVDGVWTDELTEALKTFQESLNVEPTGTVDAATIAAVEKTLAENDPAEQAAPSAGASVPATPRR
ncbi:peptidoglycan-binding protein [Actinoplanes sp. OR16]|uniref:peptidoglycan-binding domain-containing protein n=1 Tax=Actinoplanes sp. OR16 TaxID=946334 RepID=UPI001576BF6F|nr:peptidoglycan-binding protein [Actinoplanes sp. OR16]